MQSKQDLEDWYNTQDPWSDPDRLHDLHPLTPEALKQAMRVELPDELRDLGL